MEKVYIDYFKENPCKDCDAIEDCKSLGIACSLREHYINDAISKRKAIEVMAKAIRNWEFPYSPRQIGWEDLREDTKDDYRGMAEAALNALLESK